MAGLGGSNRGLIEKLEHSTIVDLLSIGVYGFFLYVAYTNMGIQDSVMMIPPPDLNVAAVQLAIVLIVMNVLFLLHDKFLRSSGGIH